MIGVLSAIALGWGLWTSRNLPFVPDIGTLLAHRGVGDYTLSMSHLFDLTGPSFAALRLPAALAAVTLLIGPMAGWLLRLQRKAFAATVSVALTMTVFFIAAHIAFARFEPMLSSKQLADTIMQKGTPADTFIIYGEQSSGSSVVFYTHNFFHWKPALLVVPRCGQHGEGSTLLWGSCYPDAPDIFLSDDAAVVRSWGTGERKWLFAEDTGRNQGGAACSAGGSIPCSRWRQGTVDGPAAPVDRIDAVNEGRLRMSKGQRDGLYLLVLGSGIFLLLGLALEIGSPHGMVDFKALYYGARCVIEHHDPYSTNQFLAVYQNDGGTFPTDAASAGPVRESILYCINLPTALLLVLPLAALPFGVASICWIVLLAGSLIAASWLMFSATQDWAPQLSGGLIFLILTGSEVLLIIGNAGGVVVSLCIVAAWCFVRERASLLGILCLTAGLVMKPQVAGLIWLFFLLAGGMYRKRAVQTLLASVLVAAVSLWWIGHVSPHWMSELSANLATTSAHGALNDPGPSSMGGHGLAMVISLQAPLSILRDDPHFYNPLSVVICAVLLIFWLLRTLRKPLTPRDAWIALASVACITMLPVYHRSYDARLLLLTVPACALVWTQGGKLAKIALLLNLFAILMISDLFWAPMLAAMTHLHPQTPASQFLFAAAQTFPAPLLLLALGCFYLWVYVRTTGDLVPLRSPQ